jgi:hypothetical protein
VAAMTDRRPQTRYGDLPFVVIAVTCGAALLYVGRSLTFWEDEWRSITFDGGALDYVRPVNQHWSTFPLLLYRATFHVVELRSYIPYLAEVIVLHLVAVAGAYALMRKRLGPLVATFLALPLLLLGSGAENLLWAFQTGFVGSVLFGVWALFFIERPTRYAAVVTSLLLLASLASSGMGAFFLVVVAGRAILDPSLRSRALAVVPPFAVYLLWLQLLGRQQLEGEDHVWIEAGVARFAVRGIVYSSERIFGFDHLPDGYVWGLVLFLGLSLLTALRMLRGHSHPLAAGCLLGIAAMYIGIGFVRIHADPGYDHAVSSRYVYVAAFLLVLAIVDLLPARSAWSVRGRPGMAACAALVVLIACITVANVDALLDKRAELQRSADITRAFVDLAVTRGNESWVDPQAPRGWYPPIEELVRTVQQHGSPSRDELFPGVVPAPDAEAREGALLRLIGDGFRVEVSRGGGVPVSLEVVASTAVEVSKAGKCVLAESRGAPAAVTLRVPEGVQVRVTSTSTLEATFELAHENGPARPLDANLKSRVPADVVIPDVDAGPWLVSMKLAVASAVVRLCVVRTLSKVQG